MIVSYCGKDEWKCSYQESGEQCVMMAGMTEMPVLCVDNWDFQQQVITIKDVLYAYYTISLIIIIIIYRFNFNKESLFWPGVRTNTDG